MLYQVHPKLTLFAQAEYRELKDFAQDNAANVSVGGIWNLSRRSEVTFAVNYDDFEPAKDGYEDDSLAECIMGLSYTYRY
jgi:predicted porin